MKTLHIHFGPVQSFIATARTTQDLWAGSFLLSVLSRAALNEAIKAGAKAIRPYQESSSKTNTLSKVEGVEAQVSDSDVTRVATAALGGWNELWQQIADKAFGRIEERADDTAREIWDRQIQAIWEQYWAVGEYQELRRRKSVRSFKYEEEPGEKCTLCGTREALHRRNARRRDIRTFWADLAQTLGPQFIQDDGRERLCAVCFTKRLASDILRELVLKESFPFPSTAAFALVTWRLRLLDSGKPRVKDAVNVFLKALESHGAKKADNLFFPPEGMSVPELLKYDGDYFIPESYDGDRLSHLSEGSRTELKDGLRKIQTEARKAKIVESTTSFAVLSMDGDGMGQLLQKNPDLKRDISKAMTDFARQVPGIVERHWGRVVYAGGDDVLALLPPEMALDAAREIRIQFTETMRDIPGIKQPPTISAGIIFAPMTIPLQTAVRRSHYLLEDVAKGHRIHANDGQIHEKDAFAIEVWDRGGANLRLVKKWDHPDGSSWVDRIYELGDRLTPTHKVPLTKGFLYSCADLLRRHAFDPSDEEVVGKLLLVDYLRSRNEQISKLKESDEGMAKATDLIRELMEVARDDATEGSLSGDHVLMLKYFVREEVA